MSKPAVLLAAPCLALCLALAACGGDDDGGSASGGGAKLEIAADPSGKLAYTESEITAAPGEVQIDFTNDASLPHDVVIERDSSEVARTDVITGDSTTADATLEAGSYTFYCSVAGHREAGMEGTLTVE